MFKKLLLAVLAVSALPAFGSVSYYIGNANQGAFESAIGSVAYHNFSGASGLPLPTYTDPSGVTFGGYLDTADTISGTLQLNGTSLQLSSSTSNTAILVTPSATLNYVGVIFNATGPNNFCYAAAGASTQANCAVLDSSTSFFVGVISDTPIAAFQMWKTTGFGGNLQVTQMISGTISSQSPPSDVPEPSTMALMGGALIALPLLKRRRTKA